MGSTIGIDTIFVLSLTDYNADYIVNDTLNNILLANYWSNSFTDFDNFFPLHRYINENSDGIGQDIFEIKISEAPLNDSGEYQFKIILILKNGDIFEQISDKIRLTK